jgi:GT2 family glycosyltransferase
MTTASGGEPEVDVLVLVYEPVPGDLARCVESILRSPGVSVVIAVNNDSPDVRASVANVAENQGRVEVVELGRNWGYAGGINRGLTRCRGELVLLLNDDAFLEPGALELLVDEMEAAAPDVVAVVPKIVFDDRRHLIDACGATTTSRAATYNRGACEVDVGQYDDLHEVAGACFAAVLLRREAFDVRRVGPLAERFFMYGEDADWCLRARLHGHRFLCQPAAVVSHMHSGSTTGAPSTWKADLIDRNSWWLAVRCLPARNAVFVSAGRLGRHAGRAAVGPERASSRRILGEVLAGLPWALRGRRRIRGGLVRRSPGDAHLFALATDTGDHVELRDGVPGPRQDLETAVAIAARRWHRSRSPEDARRLAATRTGAGWGEILVGQDATGVGPEVPEPGGGPTR